MFAWVTGPFDIKHPSVTGIFGLTTHSLELAKCNKPLIAKLTHVVIADLFKRGREGELGTFFHPSEEGRARGCLRENA